MKYYISRSKAEAVSVHINFANIIGGYKGIRFEWSKYKKAFSAYHLLYGNPSPIMTKCSREEFVAEMLRLARD